MTADAAPPASQPLPARDDFPVRWEDPDDARLHWRFGLSHWSTPMTPFDFTIDGAMVWAGADAARRHYGLVENRTAVRRFNTYYYLAQRPPRLDDDERAARARTSDARIDDAIARLPDLWLDRWLPELREHHAWWEAFDRAGADDAALAAHAGASLARMARLWELHFLILTPGSAALALLTELCRELFALAPLDVQKLVQGFDNKTVQTGRALWRLAQAAAGSPEVAALLAEAEPSEVGRRLGESEAGRAFRERLDAVLAEYGQRYENWLPSNPSWIEDPTPAIARIRDMVGAPDPGQRLAELAAEREERLAEVRARLAGYPGAVAERFELLLRGAQMGVVLLEDHGYWIDTRGTYKVRRVFVEVGRRLARRGVVEAADDVFHLWPEEALGALLAEPAPDHRAAVALSRAEIARFGAIRPPMELGTPAPPAPAPVDAVGRAQARLGGAAAGPAVDGLLRGVGASAGRARGTARVARRLADAARLRPGDVLVAETTSPAWTPLFATAAAVVTDVGGFLGHCAVVAREYRIPAVVGAAGATTRIRDGQVVEVDGDAGTVRVVAD